MTDAEALGGAGPEILDEDVGFADQAVEQLVIAARS